MILVQYREWLRDWWKRLEGTAKYFRWKMTRCTLGLAGGRALQQYYRRCGSCVGGGGEVGRGGWFALLVGGIGGGWLGILIITCHVGTITMGEPCLLLYVTHQTMSDEQKTNETKHWS